MCNRKKQSGFTLVETIMVSAVFGILSIALATIVYQFYQTNAYAIAQSAEVQSASRGVEFLVRDVREAALAEDGSYPIVTASTSTLAVYSDVDRDDSVEYVEYRLEGTKLYKDVTSATGSPPSYATTTPDETILVSDHVRNIEQTTPTFRFYNSNGTEIDGSNVSNIASIRVEIIVNVDPTKSPGLFTLSSHATLRNLKSNL